MRKNWQWVFPQHLRLRNSETGERSRHHLDPSLVQKATRRAVRASEINKPAPLTASAIPSGSATLALLLRKDQDI
jgi:acyl dehydratase